ncbi:hypothetical protein QA648_12560 [Rhizobium sp. CB3171]|uniref:hypothetical protein n=1 Tax=Rhizobium sp. CB3171 TaxID=3039157 RepID=UPI0024B0846B|nr:hypothetical protein [Rhizobium sp. CB3171]WFU00984.1 hypothetical protein QA648_12560 [Rhizobium sp. CB3171]
MAAINFDPASVKFLWKVFGIEREAAKYALTYETAYQFAGRTSLRMEGSSAPIVLIFGDRATAKAIQSFIPGCADPELIDLGIPELLFPDDEPESDDEAEVKAKPVKTVEETREEDRVESQLRRRRNRVLENHAATLQYEGFRLRFWAHYSSFETLDSEVLDWETVLEYFRTIVNREEISQKDANKLFREGVLFDSENHLLKDNILSTKIVVLDIDNVTGDVKELSAYLKSRKISHLVVSTYRCLNVENYSERQIKIRVLVPLTEAVDAENYSRIIRLLNRDIREKFPQGEFGSQFPVDPACMTINNRFYAPCRPEKGEPIFIDGTYYEYDCFVKKAPVFLDVKWCMVRNLPEDLEAPVIKRHIAGSVRKTAEEIVLECAAMASAGNGDGPWYDAAVELIKAGYSKDEAIAAMKGKERMFGSGKGRSAERAVTHVVEQQRFRAA